MINKRHDGEGVGGCGCGYDGKHADERLEAMDIP
jgi:hypothetical protein